MIGMLYRYPHPVIDGRWLYVGQGSKRDKKHRAGITSFGRRFKKKFPGITLPQPVREEFEVQNQIELNEEETIWMFRFHTWYHYPDGMNIVLPGCQDYRKTGVTGGRIGGRKNADSGQVQAMGRTGVGGRAGGPIGGKIVGRMCAEKKLGICGQSKEKMSQNGKKGGLIAGRKSVDDKTGIHAPCYDHTRQGRINGQRNIDSGHLARLNATLTKEHYSKMGVISMHKRRHLKLNKVNPRCVLCSEESLIVAWG